MAVLNVYPGRDRPSQITVKLNGVAVDFTATTRMLLTFREVATVADTAIDASLIDWTQGGGVIIFKLNGLGLAAGLYTASLFAYDGTHPNGQPIIRPEDPEPLQFRVVSDYDTVLIIQDETGAISGANAYIDAAYFITYHEQRGNVINYDKNQIEQKIIAATDYVNFRFTYKGTRLLEEQTTAWPRTGACDRDGFYVAGIPTAVKHATAEYALRALSAQLAPDPVVHETGAGIKSKSEETGPLKESVEFVEGSSIRLPRYPAADLKLKTAGLLMDSFITFRA